MKRHGVAEPRRLGLLRTEGGRAAPRRGRFAYAPGDRIAGDLTVIGHLAVGRFGHLYQVWSATEWCALTCKIVAPDRRDERAALAALRREARILRLVRHPGIVRSFGGGEHDGLPFLLIEYLDGPSLFDIIDNSPDRQLDVDDAVRSAIHIAAALYHLHRNGFLYLDLKPANLLLRDGVPVLVDLDAVRRVHDPRRPVRRVGTAPYMAPEQVRREPLSRACDVYGLGALLYEMLTGRWPFEHVYLEEEPAPDDARQYPQIRGAAPPPLRTIVPGITASLDETVMRCLAHDPADRFDSMHPVLLDLAK
ncbi:MAG: serine/threonine-protein kinase, partial [Longimicrobiales bacterium]